MNNTDSSDLFNNNIEIPAFDAGTSVPAQSAENTNFNETNFLPFTIIISVSVLLIVVAIIMFTKRLKEKQLNKINEDIQVRRQIKAEVKGNKKEDIPQSLEIKTKKEASNFSTPTNLDKCIRLFLENTRNK